MRTEYKHNPPIPYSLHDMRVKKIITQDKTITLEFEDGYEKLTESLNRSKETSQSKVWILIVPVLCCRANGETMENSTVRN